LVSLKQDERQQIAEEIWEAAKAILRKYNKPTGTDFKAVGTVLITFKENGAVHVSMKGVITPSLAFEALKNAFDREESKQRKGESIAVS